MIAPRCLGHHSASNREVYLLTLDDLDAPFTLPDIQGRHFTCFCALNAEGLPADQLGKFCSHLDEEIVGDNPPQSYIGCVMTTWHAKDSLTDALSFFLDTTEPDEAYAPNGCNVALIITRTGNDWKATIEKFVTAEIAASPS